MIVHDRVELVYFDEQLGVVEEFLHFVSFSSKYGWWVANEFESLAN